MRCSLEWVYCLVYRQACHLAVDVTQQRVQGSPFLGCIAQTAGMHAFLPYFDHAIVIWTWTDGR